MVDFDGVTNKNIKEHNPNWPQIPDHLFRVLVFGGSGSGKSNSSVNWINHQQDIHKMYLYAKDTFEAKYHCLINKQEKKKDLKHFNYSEAFIVYSNDIDDIYKNVEEHNPNKRRKILIIFDVMIADMLSNKKCYASSNWNIYEKKETKHFSHFYDTILFCCTKKY